MTTTTLTRGFDRRSLLKATGVVGLAIGGLAYVPTAALAYVELGTEESRRVGFVA